MDKVKLLIVDSDSVFTDQALRFMKNYPDIEIIGCDQNGQNALHSIKTRHPDAVLFDLLLPGMDGISLLRSVNDINHGPAMICCTRFYSDVAMEAMRTFGAAYLLYKPVELHALHPVITSCARLYQKIHRYGNGVTSNTGDQLQQSIFIRNYIISLGIPGCLLYTSPSPRDGLLSRMPSSA